MKKRLLFSFWLLLTLGMTTVMFHSCKTEENPEKEEIAPDEPKEPNPTEGAEVVINGVTWATRNLSAPGAFVANFQDFGMYYQWNRKTGWSTTNPLTNSDGGTTWDNAVRADNSWEKDNDPSPVGWRVPARNEINSLLDADKVLIEWTTVMGVKGRLFTDKASGKSLFLPAAGNRDRNSGALDYVGANGYYWSSAMHNSDYVYYLYFSSFGTIEYSCYRNFGQSIRCVKE